MKGWTTIFFIAVCCIDGLSGLKSVRRCATFVFTSPHRVNVVLKSCALVLFFLSSGTTYSQNYTHEIDSLKGILDNLPEDALDERGRVYIELGRRIRSDEIALKYCDSALATLKDSTQIIRATHNKAAILRSLKRNQEARAALESVLHFAQKSRPYQKATELNRYLESLYGMLSAIYAFDGEYRLALQAADRALELGALFPGKANLSRTYNHLGIILYKLRDNERALRMYHKALELQKYPDGRDEAYIENYKANRLTMLTNIGICYSEIDSLSSALTYFDSARNSSPTLQAVIHINFGYGMVFLKQSKYREAEAAFQNALNDARKISDLRMVAECQIYSARVYLKTKRYNDAQKAIIEAERLAEKYNLNEILLDTYRQALILFTETTMDPI